MRVSPVGFHFYLAQQLDLDALVLYLFARSVGNTNLQTSLDVPMKQIYLKDAYIGTKHASPRPQRCLYLYTEATAQSRCLSPLQLQP